MQTTFQIRNLCPRPSMNEQTTDFCGTYAEAKQEAEKTWRATGRATSVVESCFYLYRIAADGSTTDKNPGVGTIFGRVAR